MNRAKKVIRPSFDDSDDESDYEAQSFSKNYSKESDEDDEMASISFGSLHTAQRKIEQEESAKNARRKNKSRAGRSKYSDSDSDSDSDDAPEESSTRSKPHQKPSRQAPRSDKKKKNKHAPSESSSKAPVSKVREIEGLGTKYKDSSLYRDIRFDAAYGKADLAQIRKNYAFLDDYREDELKQMKSMLKDKKSASLLSHREREDIEYRAQSLKSRLDTMKNRDLESKILADHKKEQLQKFKDGSQNNPYFLKKSEKRKLIQKAKFDTMKASQREKVMERKRKRRLGKEFRELEFNQQR